MQYDTVMVFYWGSYRGDHATRSDTVIHTGHAHVVRVLSPPHEVLVSHVAWTVIDHKHAAFHSNGAAVVKHRVQVGTVAHALIVTASKVLVLIEDDLTEGQKKACKLIFDLQISVM